MRLKTKYPVLLTWFWFDKIYGFVRVYDGTRYLVLLRSEKYDSIYDRISYLISGITYIVSQNYATIKVDSYNSLPQEQPMTFVMFNTC